MLRLKKNPLQRSCISKLQENDHYNFNVYFKAHTSLYNYYSLKRVFTHNKLIQNKAKYKK